MTSFRSVRAALVAALACGALAAPGLVAAHAEHGKPAHGGIVGEAGVFQGELVADAKGATLYLTDHGQPVPTAGATARVVVLSGASKSELELQPAGDNRFAAPAGQTIPRGSKAVATVKLRDGRSGALRFDVK